MTQKRDVQIERVLSVWGVIVILWSLYRIHTSFSLPFNELVAKPIIFLSPIALFLRRYYKTVPFYQAVGLHAAKPLSEIAVSLFLYIFLFIVGMVTVSSQWAITPDWKTIAPIVALSFVTATVEEIVGRGFLFRYLVTYTQRVLYSFLFSSLLFFVLYLPGLFTSGLSGSALLFAFLLNIGISIVASTLFLLRGSLYLPIAAHAAILIWFDLLLI